MTIPEPYRPYWRDRVTCGRQSPQEKALIAVTKAFTDAALRLAAAALLAVFVLVLVGG